MRKPVETVCALNNALHLNGRPRHNNSITSRYMCCTRCVSTYIYIYMFVRLVTTIRFIYLRFFFLPSPFFFPPIHRDGKFEMHCVYVWVLCAVRTCGISTGGRLHAVILCRVVSLFRTAVYVLLYTLYAVRAPVVRSLSLTPSLSLSLSLDRSDLPAAAASALPLGHCAAIALICDRHVFPPRAAAPSTWFFLALISPDTHQTRSRRRRRRHYPVITEDPTTTTSLLGHCLRRPCCSACLYRPAIAPPPPRLAVSVVARHTFARIITPF